MITHPWPFFIWLSSGAQVDPLLYCEEPSEKVMNVGAGGNRLVTCCSPVQVLTLPSQLISLLYDAFGNLLL